MINDACTILLFVASRLASRVFDCVFDAKSRLQVEFRIALLLTCCSCPYFVRQACTMHAATLLCSTRHCSVDLGKRSKLCCENVFLIEASY